MEGQATSHGDDLADCKTSSDGEAGTSTIEMEHLPIQATWTEALRAATLETEVLKAGNLETEALRTGTQEKDAAEFGDLKIGAP